MRFKILQIGKFYIRFDLTVLTRFNVLLGFNYCEGRYMACLDSQLTDCMNFEYCEFQIGFLLFTINIGKEIPLDNERSEDSEIQ